jgi:hypothetical protein
MRGCCVDVIDNDRIYVDRRGKNRHMKIRKKEMTLIRGTDERWYLCEHVNKKDKGNLLIAHGKVIDVTESVEPRLAGSAEYVRRLEAALVNKIKENYKLKGLTPMDTDIVRELESLREKVR